MDVAKFNASVLYQMHIGYAGRRILEFAGYIVFLGIIVDREDASFIGRETWHHP